MACAFPMSRRAQANPSWFVHGAFSDFRVWQPQREDIAKRYRFIAYTQRYFGSGAWADEGKNYESRPMSTILPSSLSRSISDRFISSPGHTAEEYATTLALKNPSLVRTLTLHEPALLSVLPQTRGGKGSARRPRQVH